MAAEQGVPLGSLADLVSGRIRGSPAVRIGDVTHDSRDARPGGLFVAVPGFRHDGHAFVPAAVEAGAAAVCVERVQETGAPQLVVDDTRAALPRLAAEVHGHPSRRTAVVGVTGTNGKTTVTYMLEAIGEAAGRRCGLIGTIGARVAGRPVEVARTTPEASDLQRLLARMVEAGVGLVAMEVSSHALALGRADATWYEVAAFTNLSQDHLDFHGDLETYFATKASLFRPDRTGRAVIWVEGEAGHRLAGSLEVPLLTVGLSPAADLWGEEVSVGITECSFVARMDDRAVSAHVPLGGDFNVANALVALGCAAALGIDPEEAAAGLAKVPPVPGRFESVDAGQDFAVLVDYAHTPEGIEVVVDAARRLVDGRVIVVVGAGGDRDRGKRPLMGAAAARADKVLITSDNPRSEDPMRIIDQVVEGARRAGGGEVEREPDRRRAIREAIRAAQGGDAVLILGKGHEQGQEFADRVEPFDDRRVAEEELRS